MTPEEKIQDLYKEIRLLNEKISFLEKNQITHEYDEETGYCLCTCCRHGV